VVSIQNEGSREINWQWGYVFSSLFVLVTSVHLSLSLSLYIYTFFSISFKGLKGLDTGQQRFKYPNSWHISIKYKWKLFL
jgi:hypothetical protein